jgi:hypothetical protein
MPTTPRYGYPDGVRHGRKQAAELLIKTAEDYEQMAAQEQKAFEELAKNRWLLAVNHRQKTIEYSGKAKLLRGQAQRINELT